MDNKTSDNEFEIDLILLKNKMAAGIKAIIVALLRFCIRKAFWLVSLVGLGLLLGFAYHEYLYTPEFWTTSLVEVNHVQPAQFILQVGQLNQLLQREDKTKAAQVLNMTIEDVGSINKVNARWLIEDDDIFEMLVPGLSLKDSLRAHYMQLVYIELLVSDPSVIPAWRKAFSSFVNQHEWFSQIVRMETRYFDQMIRKIDQQIVLLDSLALNQELLKNKQSGDNQLVFLSEPKSYHFDILALYDKRQRYVKRKEFESGVYQTLIDFSEVSTPEKGKPVVVRQVLIITLLIGLFLIFLFENREKIIRFVKANNI